MFDDGFDGCGVSDHPDRSFLDTAPFLDELRLAGFIFSIAWLRPEEVEVKLGEHQTGYIVEARVDAVSTALTWLGDRICCLYPHSDAASRPRADRKFTRGYIPGSPAAVAAVGCTCPEFQPQHDKEIYIIRTNCPAHW